MRKLTCLVMALVLTFSAVVIAEAWQSDITFISGTDTLYVTFGRAPDAVDGVDSFDVILPIAPPSPPYAYFAIDDPANPYVDMLYTDIRADDGDSVMWQAVLNSMTSPLYGEWDYSGFPPGDFYLGAHYIGLEVTEWIDMSEESSVSFWPAQVLDIIHIPGAYLPDDDPVFSNWDPIDGALNVPVTTDIQFDVTDAGSGIDPATISLSVNGADVTSMIEVSPITGGYSVTYEPPVPLPGETWISVIASASDNAEPANSATDIVAFQTGHTIIPVLWEVPIVAYTVDALGADTSTMDLSLGVDYAATSGLDIGLDVVYPIPPPYIFYAYFPLDDPAYPLYTMLTRDIHSAELITDSWNIMFGNVDITVGVMWDPLDLPIDRDCYIAATFPPFYPEDEDWEDMSEMTYLDFGPGRQVWIKLVSPSGDTAAPKIAYTIPGDGETGVAVSTTIFAAIVDIESGVDSSSIGLVVDGDDVTASITITASGGTTYVEYIPPVDFDPMTDIDCELTVSDLADPANTKIYDWDFTTGYFLTPAWMESLAVWTSETDEPLRHFTLYFGADSTATDYFDYGLDQQMPPPVPGDIPYGYFLTPDTLWNQLTRDIRSSLAYEILWSATINRISSLGGTINWITWNPDGLPEDGSFEIAWLFAGDTTWQNMRTIDRIDITTPGNLVIRFRRGVPPTYCLSGSVWTEGDVVAGAIVEIVGFAADTADSFGNYEICEIPYSTEAWTIITTASGYISDTATFVISSDTTYNPYLEATYIYGTVSGNVSCADSGDAEGAMVILDGDTTYANADGDYIFEDVLYGEYIIEVSLMYYQSESRNILVDEPEEIHDFVLTRNIGNLGGTVSLEDGPYNLSGSVIELVGMDIPAAYTNFSGYYVFIELPYGVYDVRFSHDGWVTFDTTIEFIQPVDTLDVTLEIEGGILNPPRNLEGFGNYPNRAVLDWDSPETGVGTLLGYNVYRQVMFTDDTLVGYVMEPYTAFVEWNLTSYLPYNYYVTAVYEEGESEQEGPVLVWLNPDSTYPDILVWDYDNGALLADSGSRAEDDFMFSYLECFDELYIARTGQDQNINDRDLFQYRAIFLITGIDDENNALPNYPSINRLSTYIAAGGRVYSEGADFGYDFGSVMAPAIRQRLFGLFGVAFVNDGYQMSSGNITRIRGEDTSFFTTGVVDMDYAFMTEGDQRLDEWDEDTLIEGSTHAMFSQETPPPAVSPLRMVYRKLYNFKTVASSAYIGSMIDGSGPSTRMHVITAIVNYLLDEEFPPPPPPLVEEKGAGLPEDFAINASPNPFNASCKLSLEIDKPGDVRVDVFDINGRLIANLADKSVSAGNYSVTWNGMTSANLELPSGVYFAVMSSGDRQVGTKLVLLK